MEHYFLNDVTNWNNHRPLLLKALMCNSLPILELGMGDGSTPFLQRYCQENDRILWSFDNNAEWAQKFYLPNPPDNQFIDVFPADNIDFIKQKIGDRQWGVALVDNAPGESRWELIEFLKDKAEIIVVHDREPAATGYMLNKIYHLFDYKVDFQSDGAWATALSNVVDVSSWAEENTLLETDKNGKTFTFNKFSMRPNKTVILSCNDNPDYLKYYPAVAWAWNQLGWNTLLFYYGKHSALVDVIKPIHKHWDNANQVVPLSSFAGYRAETITQVSRLFGGMVYADDRMLMTGDIDMIPLSNYWHPKQDDITVYGHDLTDFTQFPICYIAMRAGKWREVMGCPDKTTMDQEIKFMLDSCPDAKAEEFEKWWSVDQEYITNRLKNYTITHIERHKDGILALGRADRYDWETTKQKGTIDAHMPRPYNEEAVRFILQKAFGKLPKWM